MYIRDVKLIWPHRLNEWCSACPFTSLPHHAGSSTCSAYSSRSGVVLYPVPVQAGMRCTPHAVPAQAGPGPVLHMVCALDQGRHCVWQSPGSTGAVATFSLVLLEPEKVQHGPRPCIRGWSSACHVLHAAPVAR